jgi:hypothetical protein
VDLNGDGILDLISGRYSPPLVTLFEGTKDGFKKGVFIPEAGITTAASGGVSSDLYQAASCFADLDQDGDLDLIVGCNVGKVYVNINEGSAKQFRFGRRVQLTAGGQPMKVVSRSDPVPVDWDGDGVLDLLVSDENCGITFFKGQLTKGPERGQLITFAAGVPIVPSKPTQLVPGYRARATTADWNNDGKLDLLVGNCENNKSGQLSGRVYLFLRK